MTTTVNRHPAHVTVNGKNTSSGSVVVVLAYDYAHPAAIALAEAMVRAVTGCEPYTWRDGQGTVTIGASGQPARAGVATHD